MTGVATAAALAPVTRSRHWKAVGILAGFSISLFLHGVLDYLPHWYPFPSGIDLLLAVTMSIVAFGFTERTEWTLVAASLIGAVLPDIIDLGPTLIEVLFGLSIPSLPFKLFPWHWEKYSGAVYDGSNGTISAVLHISIVVITGLILFLWPALFKKNEDE